ncbi:PIH1 domain-containing protein 2 [Podochytrium sp. JEL0797]|nr:PIH1 domain-containing protein 2 [Podochytrium sp. JEL0797]
MLMQKGSKIWKHLDELAAKDPQAYQEYIKSVKQSAEEEANSHRHIKPGFRIETKEVESDLSRVWHVNFAVTDKLAPPPKDDPLNIPICLSEIRTAEDKKSKVVDAVINPAVLEKCTKDSFFKSDLINLVVDCIKETHNVTLSKRTHKIIEKEYMGPFGWDDKGKPLTDADISKTSDIKVPAAAENASSQEPELPSLKMPSVLKNPMAQKTTSNPTKPIIEIIQLETEQKAVASWNRKETASHSLIYCKSQSEIEMTLVAGSIEIKTALHTLSIPFPSLTTLDSCTAKFIRTTETLKLKISK